jgi:hypothetical protein
MCSLSTLLYKKLDIDTLQILNGKRIARKYLSGKLHIGDVSKSFYCERKENGYKDSVCSEQCTICGLIEKTKQ